jgi:hypothetical protein
MDPLSHKDGPAAQIAGVIDAVCRSINECRLGCLLPKVRNSPEPFLQLRINLQDDADSFDETAKTKGREGASADNSVDVNTLFLVDLRKCRSCPEIARISRHSA